MHLVRSLKQTVACGYDLRHSINGKLKLSFGHVRTLALIVVMKTTYGTFLKYYFHHHQLTVISQNLALYASAKLFPRHIFTEYK